MCQLLQNCNTHPTFFTVVAMPLSNPPNPTISSLSKLDSVERNALLQSLSAYATKPTSPTNAYIDCFPAANNPRFYRGYGDNAQYWIGDHGLPLTLAFPALLRTTGKFVRSAPYFNLNTSAHVCIYKYLQYSL